MNSYIEQSKQAYHQSLFDLLEQAHRVHRQYHDPLDIQKCTLLSIKTGGCPEDCAYCPQSAHYDTGLKREPLKSVEQVREAVEQAKAQGATRFCMGASGRSVKDGPEFDRVLQMVQVVKQAGLEACVTLGMLTKEQAQRLKTAGLDTYNHNLDTSPQYYSKIIQTRTYEDRLKTLQAVREAGLDVCTGGIVGMGESRIDRCLFLAQLAALKPQPESVPINLLIPVEGTPLEKTEPLDPLELVRTIAVARILMPRARIRLSAGRASLSDEAQVLAFFAGANSLWLGDRLLTRPNAQPEHDHLFLARLAASQPADSLAH